MKIINNYLKMANVQRLSGTFKHRSYNLLEHSFIVASLFKEFCRAEGISYGVAQLDAVMNHDLVETVTGDCLYTVKNFNNLTKDCWEAIESSVLTVHPHLGAYSDSSLHEVLNEDQHDMFKACDLLELWIFCMQEVEIGNKTSEIIEVISTCEKILYGRFESITRFMENYKCKKQETVDA